MDPRKVFSYDHSYIPPVYDGGRKKPVRRPAPVRPQASGRSAAPERRGTPRRLPADEVRSQDYAARTANPSRAAASPVRTRENPKNKRSGITVGCVVRRTVLVLFTVLLLAVYALLALVNTIAKGPSESVRNLLVLSAMQASATKWVPGLFLDDETVAKIIADSEVISTDVISLEEYAASTKKKSAGTDNPGEETDEWANAIDGMKLEFISGSTYKAYVLLVRDPARVYVGTSSDYKSGMMGARIFDITARDHAVAAINGGEFYDVGGQGTGDNPIGLTYSHGKCVWNDGYRRTFIGFDSENRMVVNEKMTKAEADALGIRDAVSFQTGNVLINHDGEKLELYYADSNTGTAQRTAIGQRADGTVIFLVTDGRTASSLGATHNDVIDVMVSYGAICAAMLDGGSSTMLYYEDYYTKYGIDTATLDQYQLRGLVNKYKAFTNPRRIPTYFMVSGEE